MNDFSLTDHGPEASLSHKGLDYPMGLWVPPPDRPHEVAPGVRWLAMPLPLKVGHINLWLLDDHDERGPGTAIVDTGLNTPTGRDVWQTILPGIRVTRIFATHFHPDHTGLAGWLAEKTGAPLWMTRAEYLMGRMLQLDARDQPPAEALAFVMDAGWPDASINNLRSKPWNFFSRGVAPFPATYRRMIDGEKINIGGRQWRVVVGTGHSPEHACLVCGDDKLMISGDQVLPKISSNISVSMMEPMADPLYDWLESIKRFKKLPSDLLVLPAHNSPFHGLHERLDQLELGHRQGLEALYHHCLAPRTVHECFTVLFKRPIDEGLLGLATGEAMAHLRYLEARGRVRRERHGTTLRFRAI